MNYKNRVNVNRSVSLLKKHVLSPIPGRRSTERDRVESTMKAMNVKNNERPHAYNMYKKNRFRSENIWNPFVVL